MLLRSKFRYHSNLLSELWTHISNCLQPIPSYKLHRHLKLPTSKAELLIICLPSLTKICFSSSMPFSVYGTRYSSRKPGNQPWYLIILHSKYSIHPDLCRVYLPIYPETVYSLPFPCYSSVQASVIFWGLLTACSFQVSLLVPCLLCYRDPL